MLAYVCTENVQSLKNEPVTISHSDSISWKAACPHHAIQHAAPSCYVSSPSSISEQELPLFKYRSRARLVMVGSVDFINGLYSIARKI